MLAALLYFALGFLVGLRSLTAPAVICWGAYLGCLHLGTTKLAFLGRPSSVAVVSLLAVAELIADKLPQTPARTQTIGLLTRITMAGFSAVALAIASERGVIMATFVAIAGAIAGTFIGYKTRRRLTLDVGLPDIAVALVEDAIAIAGSLLIVLAG